MISRSSLGAVLTVALLLGASGAFSGTARSAEKVDRLQRIDNSLGSMQSDLDRLSREFGQRRGLVGAEDALERYEDAVYSFLVGEYERAALSFHILVESEALTSPDLYQDSQWYLGECLLELGNWKTALDAYDAIVNAGQSHPFFADAVRRQIEIYGILRDNQNFLSVYNRYILTGVVPSTDAVKYTVAKTFYRQGETPRAKSLLMEIPATSEDFPRARYYLGSILAAEGDYQSALIEFQKVAELPSVGDVRVQELTWLALGRIYYEVGDYGKATTWYEKVQSGSEFFADHLYEMAWTQIKQKNWAQALNAVDAFLISYPEHRYTMQMKLTQAHLQMKASLYDDALVGYEKVVEQYTPLHDRLARMEGDREDPGAFFNRLLEDTAPTASDDLSLPSFAVEMLMADPELGRAVAAASAVRQQDSDLKMSRSAVEEINKVLESSRGSIGTFGQGRAELMVVRDDTLLARQQLLGIELDTLAGQGSASAQEAVKQGRRDLEALVARSQSVQGEANQRNDLYQAHEDQVREVQRYAFFVLDEANRLRAESEAVGRVLEERKAVIQPRVATEVAAELARVQGSLNEQVAALEWIQSDATANKVLGSVADGAVASAASDPRRGELERGFEALHLRLRDLRGGVSSEGASALARVDQQWLRAGELDARAQQVMGTLVRVEGQERLLLEQKLGQESGQLARLEGTVTGTRTSSESLAVEVTRHTIGQLEDQLDQTIMQADMGVVDVYWMRKSELTEEMTRLARERAQEVEELDSRFKLIRQKLEE